MTNVYNCNNCLYSTDCKKIDVIAEQGCFCHSYFDLESHKLSQEEYDVLWDAKYNRTY